MSLLVIILVGLIAGWLAGNFVRGSGMGVVADIVVGIVGALIGGYVFGLLGIYTNSFLGSVVTAVIGAVILLFVVGFVRRRA